MEALMKFLTRYLKHQTTSGVLAVFKLHLQRCKELGRVAEYPEILLDCNKNRDLWALMVIAFGDYVDEPDMGWVDDIDGCVAMIDRVESYAPRVSTDKGE